MHSPYPTPRNGGPPLPFTSPRAGSELDPTSAKKDPELPTPDANVGGGSSSARQAAPSPHFLNFDAAKW